ncbi:MAG: BamA/TamA family outer membrane protein [Oceanospirillaceae bacterium]|nr:BamA/TamA family outer membrane protein [Oceanospirillaceae bacterium]
MTKGIQIVSIRSVVAVLALLASNAQAINNNVEVTGPQLEEGENAARIIPYGFYNADTGLAAAAVFIGKGYIQDQVISVGNVWAGQNGSYQLFWANSDVLLPFSDRLFIDSAFMYSNWDEVDTYQSGNPDFPDERAGSNDSDVDNFITASGDDLFGYVTLRYLLPVGDGRGDPIHDFYLEKGLLVPGAEAGGRGWNPLQSGRTTLELRPFYRDQNFEQDSSGDSFENSTAGIKLSLEYDNTDWYNNPTRGTRQRLTLSRDWGFLEDSSSWTSVQFRHSQFFDLGATAKARQRVLALDVWTSDVPTWNSFHINSDGERVFHRAPLFEGSTLGGLERQRAYPGHRFHDRAAINYTAEYRYIPKWNALSEVPLISSLGIPWWQWVGFLEVGRVADKWSLGELHRDMKVSLGGGVRALVYGLVIRVDAGVSEEGGAVQMFFRQPF